MKRRSSFLPLFPFVLAIFVAPAFAQNPWEEARERTAAIRILNERNDVELYTMVDYIDDSLLCRHPESENASELIAFPISAFIQNGLKLQLNPTSRLSTALDLLRSDESADEGIRMLRPMIWPLVKAIEIPTEFSDFHRYIRIYTDALLDQNLTDEAEAMIDYFDFRNISAGKTELVVRLARIYLQEGRASEGFEQLSRLPLDENRLDLQNIAVNFGKQLRESGQFAEAVAVYERLFTLENSALRQESILWTAYCYLKIGNLESANIYLSLSDEFEPRDPEFSLKCLIEGLIHYESGDSQRAMTAVSQGIVFSRLGLDWISELMLLSGKSYEAVGRPQVAGSVYRELIQFFPNDPFAAEAKERLALLTEPEPSPEIEGKSTES